MFELITQILILVAIFFLVRYLLLFLIPARYLAWLGGIILILVLVLAFLEPTNGTVGIAWSILSFPLRPLGLSIILLAYAVSPGIKKVFGTQVLVALLVLVIASLPLTAYLLTAQTEQRSVIEASQQTPPRAVSAIVTLGDGALPTDPSYRIRTQVNPDGISTALQSRLIYTGELYQAQTARGSNPLVVISAGQTLETNGEVDGNAAIIDILNQNGVPTNRIRIDREGVEPRSSALAVRGILLGAEGEECTVYVVCPERSAEEVEREALGPVIPIALIAPAINMRRSASAFERVNFDVVPRPSDFYVFQLQGGLDLAALTDLIPNSEALVITSRVIDEYLATVYYFLRGWLVDPLGV